MKAYQVRYRQFARGRRSIKEEVAWAHTVEAIKDDFKMTVEIAKKYNNTDYCHAQLVSVFPAKEG